MFKISFSFIFLIFLSKLYSESIHIIVPLCDNKNQGIVTVSSDLGNGKSPKKNLYWGALYGVKTYFKKSKNWTLLKTYTPTSKVIAERCVFKHISKNEFIVADAYWGNKIYDANVDLINFAYGLKKNHITIDNQQIGIQGSSKLLIYAGHNGLMDFNLKLKTSQQSKSSIPVVVLACKSNQYYTPIFNKLGIKSVLMTKSFMAPEAYTIEAVCNHWINGHKNGFQLIAAKAYASYQRCSVKAALTVFSEHQ